MYMHVCLCMYTCIQYVYGMYVCVRVYILCVHVCMYVCSQVGRWVGR